LIGRLNNDDSLDALLSVVSGWRMFIGLPKNDVTAELTIATKFISDHYGNFLTLAELELAYNLACIGKLGDVEFRGYFSPEYIGKVIRAFLHYRSTTLADAVRKREKRAAEIEDEKNRPTPQQQSDNMKKIIREFYNEYKKTGEVKDVLNICYNFLRKMKVLVVTQADLEKAQKWGKEKAEIIMKADQRNFKWNNEIEYKRWARNWCVQNFFQSVDIDVLINNIKPEQFS
jgi:hypothetical protein